MASERVEGEDNSGGLGDDDDLWVEAQLASLTQLHHECFLHAMDAHMGRCALEPLRTHIRDSILDAEDSVMERALIDFFDSHPTDPDASECAKDWGDTLTRILRVFLAIGYEYGQGDAYVETRLAVWEYEADTLYAKLDRQMSGPDGVDPSLPVLIEEVEVKIEVYESHYVFFFSINSPFFSAIS